MRLTRVLQAGGALAGLFVFWLFAVWPPPVWYRTHWPGRTAFMAMRERGEDAERFRPRRYVPVPLDSMAPALPRAVLVSEDNRFYEHGGLDYEQLRIALGYPRRAFSWVSPGDLWAMSAALTRAWSRRDRLRGASTVTQQLAKNLYLSPSRNPLRKLKEAVTAYRLEWALDKRRILELYLNVVEFGPGVWGAEAASREYFDRSAARLGREQAAALAATLPQPLSANPGYRPGRLRWRQNLILRRMRGERLVLPPPGIDSQSVVPPPRIPPESIAPPEDFERLLESLRAPIETLPADR